MMRGTTGIDADVAAAPDRRRCRVSLLALMLGMAVAIVATGNNLPTVSAGVQTTVKNVQQQQQQLRVKPQPSPSGASSGLPVPDLLESPDAKYDPKPKDIDAAALRLRLKGELQFRIDFIIQCGRIQTTPMFFLERLIMQRDSFFCGEGLRMDWTSITRQVPPFFVCLHARQNVVHVTFLRGCCLGAGHRVYTFQELYTYTHTHIVRCSFIRMQSAVFVK